ncbi:hypothetical protein [Leptolinea tardivitalis]|uniref:hypothetical protein n=1 Tax=Leptolinea tardivitalis TaxID=229920 RepID=UPI00130D5CE0|nr:hypothetical protein [Leptolinea tardivitalis]GAP19896.1 hypothetical protein LTAR_00079 [Leptolinea tardivitalis]
MPIRIKPVEISTHDKEIAIGDLAPDFELIDTRNTPIKLRNFRDHKNIVLVLNRGFV